MPQSERRSFTFENVHLAPDEQIGLHQQSTWELSYVIVGSGMRLIGDMTEPFSWRRGSYDTAGNSTLLVF